MSGKTDMSCERVRATMFMVTDNEADGDLLSPFREHLGYCPECARHFDYLNKLLELLRRRCERHPAPSDLKDRIRAGFPHRRDGLRPEAK